MQTLMVMEVRSALPVANFPRKSVHPSRTHSSSDNWLQRSNSSQPGKQRQWCMAEIHTVTQWIPKFPFVNRQHR